MDADSIAAAIEDACRRDVREAVVKAFGAPPIDGLGTTGGFNLMVEDRGNLGLPDLDTISGQIVAQGNQTPGLQGLFNSSGPTRPGSIWTSTATSAWPWAWQVSDVFNTLQVYLGSYYVNNFNDFGRTWQVNIQAQPQYRSNVPDVLTLQVRNNQGQMVRLRTLMNVQNTSGPVVVMRYNLYSAAAITFNPAPGTGSAQAVERWKRSPTGQMPLSMRSEWTELAYLQKQAGNSAMWFFAWRWPSCSWCWPPSTKAGNCRWP